MRRLALIAPLFACNPAPPAVSSPAPAPSPSLDALPPPPAGYASFYAKYLDVDGLPVLGSTLVSDAAIREAGFLIRKMLDHRPDILRAIADSGVRVVVMAPTEMTTDIPEHSDLTPKDYWDRRARGLGATLARPATSCGEENLMNLDGDPYATENILIHELSHTVHEIGLAADASFQERLAAAYQHARDTGLWAGTYAMTNVSEYWAETAQSWFDTNRTNDAEHGSIATREAVVDYDPDVAALLTEVYGADAWRYVRPFDRAPEDRAHLAGADRSRTFSWPTPAATDDVVELELLTASPGASSGDTPTSIQFINALDHEIEVLWLDFTGAPVSYATVRPGATHMQATFAGHVWQVRDAAGTRGYVIAAPSPGRATVGP